MAKKQTDEVLERVARQASRLREAASELSDRIVAFENWVTSLDAHVPVSIEYTSPAGPKQRLALGREGKKWRLMHSEFSPMHKMFHASVPLSNSPLDVKLNAVKHLPTLLDAIHKFQQERLEQIASAQEVFDFLEVGLPLEKEGA